ncbi:MAG: hypothetical protein Pg6C_09350 [Treponemataceae bacterium]|nr:MAG: hypothetical protein Pg6C_09350 [Treponemataceae bacterium]
MYMKHAFFLIIKFIVLHLVFLIVAGTVYYFYLQSTQIVAGETMRPLPLSSIFPALPFILACSSIAAGFSVQGSCVRTAAKLPAQITSALLVIAVWAAVIPLCAKMRERFFPGDTNVSPVENISPGFFRQYSNGIFFATRGGQTASGIFLQTADPKHPVLIENLPAGLLQSPPYSDALIADTMRTPVFLSLLADEAGYFAQIGQNAVRGGYFSWLCFASICLPFAAISALTRAGSWKLKNATVMIFAFVAITAANHLYYTFDVFGGASAYSDLSDSQSPDTAHVAFNALTGVIISLLGIAATLIAAHKAKISGAYLRDSE